MTEDVAKLIRTALEEDIGPGDVTTEFFVPSERRGQGCIVARESCVVAGTETSAEVFRTVDPTLQIDLLQKDGETVTAGAAILEVRGSTRPILTAERVALNFLQHLSGIATATRRFVDAVAGYPARILDTRKTIPGLRRLEKAAVLAGGGMNHRFGLYDMALVKDNHLSASGLADLQSAIKRLQGKHPGVRIEVEADRLNQVQAFVGMQGIDVILLDNMTTAEMREAVALGRGKVQFEASGGVTLETVREIAATGVDFISIGSLTHSVRAIDFSLEFTNDIG